MNNINTKAKTGREGEDAAVNYLHCKGYEILNRNYRYRRSEVDIIAKKDEIIVFVEVKTKTSTAFGFPEEAVNHVKIKKVTEAADYYTYEMGWQKDIRFDIISYNKATDSIDHFIDAFY
ncbi:YraN family protein [Fulvivirga maritima]|uniref:YraN family protein n=1 Tax=Fulvivirga maritima TaxID=2904247 RepID=UPI001F23AFD3|nr:YraN family protein [Fulvivirga maritima]UII28240.1 YraN family protein [Fulvivirga maritima]